jgi:hypothetical protein
VAGNGTSVTPLPHTSVIYQKEGATQCCGSRQCFTGSGSDFRKRPDPDPDPNKFAANFFLKTFLMKICSKKYLNGPKSQITLIPQVFMAFTHTKKVDTE